MQTEEEGYLSPVAPAPLPTIRLFLMCVFSLHFSGMTESRKQLIRFRRGGQLELFSLLTDFGPQVAHEACERTASPSIPFLPFVETDTFPS